MSKYPGEVKVTMHDWSTMRIELLWAYSGPVSSDVLNLNVDHSYGYWLWFIKKGEVELKTNDSTLNAQKGQWIICPTGSTRQQFSTNAEILSIHFLSHWPTGENLFDHKAGAVFDGHLYPKLISSSNALQKTVKRNFPDVRVQMFQQEADLEVFLKLQQQFFRMLLEIVKIFKDHNYSLATNCVSDPRVGRAIHFLNKSSLSDPIPLQRLLKHAGLSRVHLDRLLCNHIGMSTKEYWEKRREGEACYRLESSSQSSKEISYCLGFKQPSHFATWFKRRKNLTPEEYRLRTNKRLVG